MKQIYLDADDDITDIINKLDHIESERVALIPPKRSTTLQSVVNLKLLRKAAESSDNELVLVTKDPVITNVASQLKLLTAPNLETEPAVPEPKSSQPLPSNTIDDTQAEEVTGAGATVAAEGNNEAAGTSTEQAGAAPSSKPGEQASEKDKPKNSQNVPDFSRFKKWLLIGLLVLLAVGAFLAWALLFAPRATVSIEGLTRDVRTSSQFQVDPSAENSDYEERLVAGEMNRESRTLSTQFEATGEDTIGERATGEVVIVNCETFEDESITITSGTALTAANGLVYRAVEDTVIPGSSSDGPNESCNEEGHENVPVEADEIGEEYNISPTDYTVEGYDSENVYSDGSTEMTGGESEDVTIVTESDAQEARQSLLEEERDNAEEALRGEFNEDMYVLDASLTSKVDEVNVTPAVGEEAEEATLVLEVTYTLLAVEREAMEDLLETMYRSEINAEEGLGLIESGLDEAEIIARETADAFEISAEGVLGPDVREDELREELAGMEYGEAVETVEAIPNVTDVVIDLSPFWVSSVPSDTDKIDINFTIADTDNDDADNSGD